LTVSCTFAKQSRIAAKSRNYFILSQKGSDTVAQFKIINKNSKWTCEVVTFLLNIFYPNRIGQQYRVGYETFLIGSLTGVFKTGKLQIFY
jgi:hypothetical protein